MTTIDLGGRQSGKSTRAVLWALGDRKNRVIVVPSHAYKRGLEEVVRKCGYAPAEVQMVPFMDWVRGPLDGLQKEYWIDEFLSCLPGKVAGISGVTR